MSRLSIHLLGAFHVQFGDRPVSDFRSEREKTLLAYLTLEKGRPHARDELVGLLWPELPDDSARNNLRVSLHRLRKTLAAIAGGPELVLVEKDTIRLNPAAEVWADLPALEEHLRLANQLRRERGPAGPERLEHLAVIAELYAGEFLEGFAINHSPALAQWVATTREKAHRLALQALYDLTEIHIQRGEMRPAQRYARRQLELEPWREEAHRQLMSILARGGERSAALAQFERGRRVLADELGIEPEEETRALYRRIQALRAEPLHKLPSQPTPFFGRGEELAEVAWRLADPACRLLTLIGPGGIGKTRLALQAAENQRLAFLHGVVFVPLSGIISVDFLSTALAQAVGLSPPTQDDSAAHLLDYVREKELLLVLDSFEHLPAGRKLLGDILAAGPGVKLLVTSRERLHMQPEWVLALAGLPYPDAPSAPPEQFAAAQFFVRCARRIVMGYDPAGDVLACIGAICRLVEGSPLAIELCAAWIDSRGCAEMLHGLERDPASLEAPWVDPLERHRSLRATFDYSWALLAGEERAALAQLSVFRGGFDRSAAREVAGASLKALSALVDKSLVRQTAVGNGQAVGRYEVHDLIRQFAAEKLAAGGEADNTRRRHLAYFTALAETGEQALKGREQLEWIHRLDADHANVLAALTWAEVNEFVGAARLASAMWLFWFMRGHALESRRRYERLLSFREKLTPALRARVLSGYAWTLFNQTDLLPIGEIAREELEICLAGGDEAGIVMALHHSYAFQVIQGNLNQAFEQVTRGIDYSRILSSRQALFSDPTIATWALSLLLDDLVFVMMAQGQLDQVETIVRDKLRLDDARGDRWLAAYSYLRLGHIYFGRADLANAIVAFTQAVAIGEEFGDPRLISFAASALGEALVLLGKKEEAAELAEQAAQQSHEVGMAMPMSEALQLLGKLTGHHQIAPEAAVAYQELLAKHLAGEDTPTL